MRCTHCGLSNCPFTDGGCLKAIYNCPVCENPVKHIEAEFEAGTPLHPFCALALRDVKGTQVLTKEVQGESIGPLVPWDDLVRPAAITLSIPIPLVLTAETTPKEIAGQIENVLTDIMFAYRNYPPKYDWKNQTLDVQEAEKATQHALQLQLDAVKERLAKFKKQVSNVN